MLSLLAFAVTLSVGVHVVAAEGSATVHYQDSWHNPQASHPAAEVAALYSGPHVYRGYATTSHSTLPDKVILIVFLLLTVGTLYFASVVLRPSVRHTYLSAVAAMERFIIPEQLRTVSMRVLLHVILLLAGFAVFAWLLTA